MGVATASQMKTSRVSLMLILSSCRLVVRARRAGMQRAQYRELMLGWVRRLLRMGGKAHGPAGVCPDRVRRDAGMNRGHRHLLGDGVRLIHREIGNKSGRPLVPDTEACAVVASIPMTERCDEVEPLHEAAGRLAHDDVDFA